MKEIRYYTSNEFHDWQREHLPRNLVIQDIDAWVLCVSEPDRIVALIELKRALMRPEEWRPMPHDRRNYIALLRLADAAAIPLYIVFHEKGRPIEDGHHLHVFHLQQAEPEYHGTRRVLTASEFAERFPRLLNSGAA